MESIMYLVERRLSSKSKLIDLLIVTLFTLLVVCFTSFALHIVNISTSATADVTEISLSSEPLAVFDSCGICHHNTTSITPQILTNSENLANQIKGVDQQELSSWIFES